MLATVAIYFYIELKSKIYVRIAIEYLNINEHKVLNFGK